MDAHHPDTPSSDPGQALQGKRTAGARHNNSEYEPSENGYDRGTDQAVFDLSMDYSDDETLLDWEQYAGNRKTRCCGCDVSWLQRCLPCLPWVPPEWYYRYSRRQRKLFGLACVMASVILGTILLSVLVIIIADVPNSVSSSGQAGNLDAAALPECHWQQWRLPLNVTPEQYSLRLQVQLDDPFMVTGYVEIAVKISQPTLCVVLGAAAMTITNASLLTPSLAGNVSMNAELQQTTIRFPSAVRAYGSTRTIALHFTYALSQGLSGFYRSSYEGADGVARILATTQFESSAARRAFPCFDEPALKATFDLTIVAPAGQMVLFNMPEVLPPMSVAGELMEHRFQRTQPMSTYLVAFIVGELQKVTVDVPPPAGVALSRPVSVWGTPERAGDLQTALRVAAALLPTYESLFQVPYALPKLDLVAIPDFAAGAMENWGLITFRETDLLATNESGLLGLRRVTSVIAHEMAHLWFGDLVTCDYWNEIWLNEGFATYWQAAASDAVSPELDMLGTFFSGDASYALDADSRSQSTHPLSVSTGALQTPAAIEAMFDGISYEKGGAVLRMLRAYLNRDTEPRPLLRRRRLLQAAPSDPWLQGLSSYLSANRFQTATASKLWSALSDASGEDVTTWMQPWTYRPGFPVVNVTLGGSGGLDVMVSQASFTITGIQPCTGSNSSAPAGPWWLPVSIRQPGAAGREIPASEWHVVSECSHAHAVATLQSATSWVKLNAGQYGFYRVSYPQPLWAQLAAVSNETSSITAIPAADLAGLLDDSFALALIAASPISNFLDFTSTLQTRNISEVAPVQTAVGALLAVQDLLAGSAEAAACVASLRRYVQASILRPALLKLANAQPSLTASHPSAASEEVAWAAAGVLSSDYTRGIQSAGIRQVRSLVVALAREVNDSSIAPAAGNLARAAISPDSGGVPVEADIRSAVYAAYVGNGNASVWTQMQNHYLAASDAAERSRSLRALAYASTPALVSRTLNYALDAEVKSQDMASLITAVAVRSRANLQAAWTFLTQHWNELVAKLGGDDEASKSMGGLLSSIGGRFAAIEDINRVQGVYDEHAAMLKEERYVLKAREAITANIAWLARNHASTCSWLSSRGV